MAEAYEDGIFISRSTVTPLLSIASSDISSAVISWVVPSTDFVLQQNSDLTTTNWTTVTNQSRLTNVRDQVLVSPLTANRYFRLVTP